MKEQPKVTITEGKIRRARETAMYFMIIWMMGIASLFSLAILIKQDYNALFGSVFFLGASYAGIHGYLYNHSKSQFNLISTIISTIIAVIFLMFIIFL